MKQKQERGILIVAVIFSMMVSRAVSENWNFEGVKPDWAGSVVGEPAALSPNRALCINAEHPHHTRVTIPLKVPTSFVFESRVKLMNAEGAVPAAYFYAHTSEGFLALTLNSNQARLFYWRGNNESSTGFGQVNFSCTSNAWVHIKLARESGNVAAKVWTEGGREPGWSMTGYLPDISVEKVALGVWLPPDRKARASMLFDDIELRPVAPDDRVAAYATPAQELTLPSRVSNGIFESGPHIAVAAGDLVAAFNRLNGSLRHLVDTGTGQVFTTPEQRRPLFHLQLTRWSKGDLCDISSDDFKHLEWSRDASENLCGYFSDGPEPGVSVKTRIYAGEDKLLHFSIDVINSTDWAVASVLYPCFAGSPSLGKEVADDRLLFPQSHSDGIVVNAPGRVNRHLHGEYPGSAAVQMMAYYDSIAGIMLATQDPGGHCKKFDVDTTAGRSVEIKINHLRPEIPGNSEIPYDTVIGLFKGDWHDAADLYKRWASKQTWCARKLTQRDDIPAFLKEGSAGIIFGIGSPKGYNGCFGPNLELLPGIVAEYRKRAGVKHMIAIPYGWENRGTWAGINYFPAIPSDEDWRNANKALRAQGDRTAMLTSGYWWVVRRPLTSGGPAFDDTALFEKQKSMTVYRPDGTPWFVDSTAKAGTFGDWRGYSVKLCHGSEEARKTMLDIFLKTAELGTPLISFDQEIGGGQSAPCYAIDHGHPPGYGSWMWSGFRDLCEEIIRKGHEIDPEIGLFVENCGEMIIPVMATYWSRQFGVLDQGSDGEGPVGLFSYLYHEYVTAIGAAMVQGQGPLGSRVSAGLRCQALANNITRGLIPCPFAHQVQLDPKDKWTEQVSQAYFAYCRPFSSFPQFLLLGETLHPPRMKCEERTEWYIPKKKKSAEKDEPPEKRNTRSLPAVIAGRFRAPDGSVGTVIVNSTSRQQKVTVKDMEQGKSAKLYRVDKSIEKSFDKLPEELHMELEAFGVRMLIVDR